jgi:lysophospholipase L1-like esterase
MASILCFGDSITQGFVDPEGGGWTQRLRRRLDQAATFPLGDTRFPAHAVFNLGVSGDTAEGVAARLEGEARPRLLGDQVVVVIAVGVNETAFDLASGAPRHSEDRFAERLAAATAAARNHTDQVLLVGLVPCDEARMQPAPWSGDGESYGNDRIAAFDRAIGRVAAGHGAAKVDCLAAWLAGDHRPLLHDGLHPNGAGHQRLADQVGAGLARWL